MVTPLKEFRDVSSHVLRAGHVVAIAKAGHATLYPGVIERFGREKALVRTLELGSRGEMLWRRPCEMSLIPPKPTPDPVVSI